VAESVPPEGTVDRIARVRGELVDRDAEAAFVEDLAVAQHHVWHGTAVGIAVVFASFSIVDLASLGPGPVWVALLCARLAAAAAAAATGRVLDRRPRVLRRPAGRALLISVQLLLAGVALTASALRPEDALTNALSLVVVVLACTVMVPGRFTDQMAVGTLIAAGLVVVSVTRFDAPPLPTVPLVANLVGVLLLGGTIRSLMGRDQRRRWLAARRLALQLAEDRQLRDELERLAREDPLTGAANRRHFLDHLAALVADRRTRPSLVVLDLDGFKAVNDRHGHPVGDGVLVAVVDAIRTAVRDGDVVARIGGEEFAVSMVGLDLVGAAAAAERIRRAVATADVGEVVGEPVTASVGVARLRDGETADGLMARADAAMYRAKRAGGDAVDVARVAAQSAAGSSSRSRTGPKRPGFRPSLPS
jgi:diguanylate cyclase (GGDEF)-like protein